MNDPLFTPQAERSPFVPSSLNIATTERYRACLAAGGHAPSDDVILRSTATLDAAPFTICARCEVPFAKRKRIINWNRGWTES